MLVAPAENEHGAAVKHRERRLGARGRRIYRAVVIFNAVKLAHELDAVGNTAECARYVPQVVIFGKPARQCRGGHIVFDVVESRQLYILTAKKLLLVPAVGEYDAVSAQKYRACVVSVRLGDRFVIR